MTCTTQPDLARFREFLTVRGHADPWQDVDLQRALRIVDRLRYPGQPRDGGKFGEGKQNGSEKNGNGLKLVTKEEARRDFSKKKGESQKDFHISVGDNVRKYLQGLGLLVKEPLPSVKTSSVYLKGKEFDVRISDGHEAETKKQSTPPAKPEYQLVIPPGSTHLSATKVNKLLSEIVANQKKPQP